MKRQGLILPDIISEEEVKKIIAAAKWREHKLAIALGFYQAMRVSEVIKLQPEDIDKQSKLIHIRQSKGAKDRMIPIEYENHLEGIITYYIDNDNSKFASRKNQWRYIPDNILGHTIYIDHLFL